MPKRNSEVCPTFFICVWFLGGAPASLCHFFCLSVSLSVAHHISKTLYHHLILSFGTLMCKMIISPGFFQFFLILIFRAVTRLKGQKIAQNEKKNDIWHTISQEQYSIWSRWLYDQDFWFSFVEWLFSQKFDFVDCLWGKKAKNDPKWQEILSVALHILRTIHHVIAIYGTCV